MSWAVIIALIVVAILFLVMEVLVIPGATVAGIIGFILLGVAIYFTYDTYGAIAGHITVASSLVLSVLSLMLALRSNTWKKAMLNKEIDSKVNVDPDRLKIGDVGVSVGRLAPAGKGMFNNEYFEVHSQGSWIDPGKEIVIVQIEGYKVIVKLKKD